MREYRGKRIDSKEWVHGYLIGDDVIVGPIVEFDDEYFNTEYWYKVDPETVGQYTGSKNRGYEGDIISYVEPERGEHGDIIGYNYYLGVVEWDNERSGFILRCSNGNEWLEDLMNITIVGNRWDNPELLEAKQ
ncbi:YopX family protein [Paenibacillus senegalensis]|uniref:YopX family protein n=1 Tax=Paenibacillus senegalensis TaxID=1465766 RepID=UPI0002884440|nr:YopX family protein [Paenibacillus senegalensis]